MIMNVKGHRLEITSTGRGMIFGECSCGHDYKATDNRRHPGHFAPYERDKIKKLHEAHKINIKEGK
jgi:hypothetical protein